MKVRQSFVSNSSSCSFICDVCKEHAEGHDLCIQDAEMFQCENGHTSCQSHDEDFDDKLHQWSRGEAISHIKENKLDESQLEMYEQDFYYEAFYDVPAECCSLCSFETISDRDELAYYRQKFEVSKKETAQKLKTQFGSFERFKNHLKKSKHG
jgi:superoxide dismutase